jgi:hypothetical protein
MSRTACSMRSGSGLRTFAYTVSRMIIGGSAGLITEMALARSAPATVTSALPVFSLNSLRFCRVPGPALALAIAATISP